MFLSGGDFGSFDHFSDGQGSINTTWTDRHGGFSQAAYNGSSDQTGLIHKLTFISVRSSRQSTIILGTFNVITAAATAAGILYNNYSGASRSPSRRRGRVNIFTCVRSPDVYPFILSVGIVSQGIIFAVSQAQGLHRLILPSGCALISQFMWPAIFIVSYIQVVFALETTVRALKGNRFPPRSKWTVTICLTIIILALLATGLVALLVRPPDSCLASLFWFVARWAEVGFALLASILAILAGSGIVIYLKLRRSSTMEMEERVGSSRMIYYIMLAIISNALMIPFFSYVSFGNIKMDRRHASPTVALVATVAVNVTGLITGGLYLFLRSSTVSADSPASPNNKLSANEREQADDQVEAFQDSSGFDSPRITPLTTPQSLRTADNRRSMDLGEPLEELEGTTQLGDPYDTYHSRHTDASQNNSALQNASVAQTPPFISSRRIPTSSYALFPSIKTINRASKPASSSKVFHRTGADWSTDVCCDMIQPPPPIQPPGFHHKRGSSMASHTTVQIGLRISTVQDAGPSAAGPLIASASPIPSPSPPQALNTDTVMRRLPTVPHGPLPEADETLVLSPTVYSPTKVTVPHPRRVGFDVSARSTTSRTPTDSVEVLSPVTCARGNPTGVEITADWI
ncbi:hypothetical protein F5Y17DRAFT_416702 [Xylariaceae sp. FL0594]|nr:hypothetical protein F5Y17DRAFT_416702 [Xylariaceae sp. FL0594]